MADLWIAISVVQNASKAICTLHSLHKFERSVNESAIDNFVFLWHQLECMNEPLNTLLRLQSRESTMPYVDPAVRLSRKSIERVENFLATDMPDMAKHTGYNEHEEEEDERPESKQSWMTWLSRKKDGKDKKDQLPEISNLLQKTVEIMHLALSAVSVSVAEPSRIPGTPFVWDSKVYEDAVAIQVSTETGRIPGRAVAAGKLWQYSLTSNAATPFMWAYKGRCAVTLEKESKWQLRIRDAPESELRDEEPEDFEEVVFDVKKVALKRCWGSEARVTIDSSLSGVASTGIVYHFKSPQYELALEFEAVDRVGQERCGRTVTAELFEMLVFLTADTAQSESKVKEAMTKHLYYTVESDLCSRFAGLTTTPFRTPAAQLPHRASASPPSRPPP